MEDHIDAFPNLEKEKESADDDEMGIEDVLALNPPALTEHDEFVWRWFHENVNSFVYEFGLMPDMIKELRLKKDEQIIFLKKMNMIYLHKQNISRRKRESGEQDA